MAAIESIGGMVYLFTVALMLVAILQADSPGSMVTGLRERGYRVPRAVADIVMALACALWPVTALGMVWVAWSEKRAARRP